MKIIQNPVKTCDKVYALIQSLTSQIRKRLEDPKSAGTSTSTIEIDSSSYEQENNDGMKKYLFYVLMERICCG